MGATLASTGWRRTVTFGIPIAGIAWAFFELVRLKGDRGVEEYPWWALLVASIATLLLFALLEYIGSSQGSAARKQFGWVAILIGADGRLSTSKTQAMLWTVVLGVAIVYLGGIVAFGPAGAPSPFDSVQWEQYLVLLGGPFAAAVLAKVTVGAKEQSGTVQKTVTPAASRALVAKADAAAADGTAASAVVTAQVPKAADVVSNDDDEIALVDTQYLVFNLVAFAYFLVVFLGNVFDDRLGVARFALPNMPAVVLGLTSAAAATYVGNKAVQSSGPRVIGISPQPLPPSGQAGPDKKLVSVSGVNLVPSGITGVAAASATSVLVKSLADGATADDSAVLAVSAIPEPTSTSVSFEMPPVFAGKKVSVRVVTSAGVATDPYVAEVAPKSAP
jgi:hypothetical protein